MKDFDPITRFRGKHFFLSNFYPSLLRIKGIIYPTVEHAFQAMKTKDSTEKLMIADCEKPGEAKNLGRSVKLREDWVQVRLRVMYLLVKRKFMDSVLRNKLLATENRELIEGNYHYDCFWGVCQGVGANHLGKILMQVRDECRQI